MSELILNKDNFEELVIKSDVPVLVDFYATWCGPCKMMSYIVEKLADDADGEYKVGKVNIDEEGYLVKRFSLRAVPVFLIFKNGVVTGFKTGIVTKEELLDALKR